MLYAVPTLCVVGVDGVVRVTRFTRDVKVITLVNVTRFIIGVVLDPF